MNPQNFDRTQNNTRSHTLINWIGVSRIWSLTATTVPVTVGMALAACDGKFSWPLLVLALFSGWLLQLATNLLNTYGDFLSGVDTVENRKDMPQLVTGTLQPMPVFRAGVAALILGAAAGIAVAALSDWRLLFFAVTGVAGAGFYTTGIRYKYTGTALPIVMLLAGVLMVAASYFAQTCTVTWQAIIVSLPITCQVGAILHGNDMRDMENDKRAGILTTSLLLGNRAAAPVFVALHVVPYLVMVVAVAARLLSAWTLLSFFALPFSFNAIRVCLRGETPSLEGRSAQIHFVFGALLTIGLVLAYLIS